MNGRTTPDNGHPRSTNTVYPDFGEESLAKTVNAFEVSAQDRPNRRLGFQALGDARIADGRLVIYDMGVYENPARTLRGPRLTHAAAEYLGRRAQDLGLEGVQFRGLRTGGAFGKRGTEMVKNYPRGR